MALLDASDALLCKIFPTTLAGVAQRWFNNLEPGSIGCWKDLSKTFLIRFFTNIPAKHSSDELYYCKQKNGESLRSYLERFNNEAMKIEELNPDTAIQALKKGTRMGRLMDKINAKKPRTYAELMAIAQKCVDVDDGRRHQKEEQPVQERNRGGDRREMIRDRKPLENRPSYRSEQTHYTPLNTSRKNILMWIRENGASVNWPRKMNQSKQRDTSRFCRFHQDHGHDTEQCYDLKKEIERLIDNGTLRRFVARTGQDERPKRPREEPSNDRGRRDPEPPKEKKRDIAGIINVIIGGDSTTLNNRKRRRNEVMSITPASKPGRISFSPSDGQHITTPHNDALVIEGIIENYLVKKLLVDEGSAVNLITWDVYKGLGGSLMSLLPCSTPITGLGGRPIQPKGIAELEIEFGRGQKHIG